MCMACFGNRNKGSLAYGLLLCAIGITGALQLRNAYANRLNNRACRTARTEKAIGCLQRAIRLNKANPLYYANLGLLYARQDSLISPENLVKGKPIRSAAADKALAYFLKAETLKSGDESFCLNIGILYALRGERTKALHYLAKLRQPVTDGWSAFLSGLIYGCTNRTEAEKCFLHTALVSPGILRNPLPERLLAEAGFSAEAFRVEAAKRLRNEFRQTGNRLTASRLAQIEYDSGNKKEAAGLLEQVTASLPNLNRAWLYRGILAEEQRDTLAAIRCYRRAKLLDATDVLPPLRLMRLTGNGIDTAYIEGLLEHRVTGKGPVYRALFAVSLLQPETVIENETENPLGKTGDS